VTTLIPELDYLLYKMLLLAPCPASLKELESQILKSVPELLPHSKSRVSHSQLTDVGAWRSWTSFELGKRGATRFRVIMVGMVTREYSPTRDLWESFDSSIWRVPVESVESEELLRLKVPSIAKAKPCLLWGLHDSVPKEEALRAKALRAWFPAHFNLRHDLKAMDPEDFAIGLEWALSFS